MSCPVFSAKWLVVQCTHVCRWYLLANRKRHQHQVITAEKVRVSGEPHCLGVWEEKEGKSGALVNPDHVSLLPDARDRLCEELVGLHVGFVEAGVEFDSVDVVEQRPQNTIRETCTARTHSKHRERKPAHEVRGIPL